MERARAVADRYSKAVKEIEAIKKELHTVILEFLVENGVYIKRCTETGLSQNLGLPRSSVRAALKELEEEGIITPMDWVGTRPYTIDSRGFLAAAEKGLLELSKERIERILSTKDTMDLQDYDPKEPLVFHFGLGYGTTDDGRTKTKYLTPTEVHIVQGFVSVFHEVFPKTKEEETYLEATKKLRMIEGKYLPQIKVFDELTERIGWEQGKTADQMSQAYIAKREIGLSMITSKLGLFSEVIQEKGDEEAIRALPNQMTYPEGGGMGKDKKNKAGFTQYKETAWAVITMVRNSLPMLKELGVSVEAIEEFERVSARLESLLE